MSPATKPKVQQEFFFTEKQFEDFTSQPSLKEYFHQFITKKHLQSRDNNEKWQIEETAEKYGTTNVGDIRTQCTVTNKDVQSQFEPVIPGEYYMYPRVSVLSVENHKAFLEEYERIVSGDSLNATQTKIIKELKPKVISEQQEFQHFVYQNAKMNVDHYNLIHEEAKTILKAKQDSGDDRRVKSYPQYYTLHKTIGLTVGAQFRTDPVLAFQRNLLQVGHVPLIVVPSERNKLELDNCGISDQQHGQVKSSLRLSEDPVVLCLAKEHNVDVVASSCGLTTLIDNQPQNFSQLWDVPVIVRELRGNSSCPKNEKSKKLVFIEKPLPKKLFTPPELISKCYKRSIMKVLCCESDAVTPDSQDYEDDSEGTKELENSASGKSVAGNFSAYSGDYRSTAESAALTGKDTTVKGREGNDKNFVYSLWKLGKFTILIRSKLDAYRNDQTFQTRTFLSVAVKPEYQTKFGHERLTASETARMWLRSFIRPGTTLLCARVDVSTNEILRFDELNPAGVLSSGSVFNPALGIKLLFQFFNALTQLPDGCFMLSHDSKAIHCCLYKSVGQNASLSFKKPEVDLFAKYSEDGSVGSFHSSDIPWAGIDVNLFLIEHIKKRRIPGTFPPVSGTALQEIELRNRMEQEQHFNKLNAIKRKGAAEFTGRKKKKKKKKGRGMQFKRGVAKEGPGYTDEPELNAWGPPRRGLSLGFDWKQTAVTSPSPGHGGVVDTNSQGANRHGRRAWKAAVCYRDLDYGGV